MIGSAPVVADLITKSTAHLIRADVSTALYFAEQATHVLNDATQRASLDVSLALLKFANRQLSLDELIGKLKKFNTHPASPDQKVRILLNLAWGTSRSDPSACSSYLQEAIELAKAEDEGSAAVEWHLASENAVAFDFDQTTLHPSMVKGCAHQLDSAVPESNVLDKKIGENRRDNDEPIGAEFSAIPVKYEFA
eukprot:Filipodium_phascolosomae@DN2304_c0_g1_i1.p1